MSEKTPVIPNQWVQVPTSDEIDLRKLLLVLWRQKVLILLVTGVCAVVGIVYAMTARQVWTSQAVISEPSVTQVVDLQLAVDKLQAIMSNYMAASEFSSLEKPAIFQSFISAFNSMNNKRDFLIREGIYAAEMEKFEISDKRDGRALMSKLAESVSAKIQDKTSQKMTLSFSADTPELALQRLEKYIDFVQQQQLKRKNAELQSIWQNRMKMLTAQYDSAKADTLLKRKEELQRVEYSLRISKAAGVDVPLERIDSQEVFNIQLGAKGLAEKLKILNEIKEPELLNPELGKMRLQLNSLKALKLENADFQSFSMIDSPEEPFTRDKPKRPLIVVLATLLGGMLGVVIVLVRHAFRRSDSA
ncbi:LPS O-antigen chain length determinant protein WzzB [Aeromonas veronii]|uniref:LPS O-antigen chain length determinant protein WzzB n=1 Tax=Aeromonas veronii TaxID=654 RepID=UPI000F5E1F8D|nr:Wzz/FepE/Etk N-terminal domain-containing protein [Aeromonas veronii]MBA2081045.1 O-antigen chain length regulator [Aeromonas veronii]MCX0420771.1 Wzz/FepE/Etk N-terminal domain-containing protein [Aeromonas veronii]RRA90447.1 O-antigen chain length regulator [Aeromonas veronii bv. sobria]TNI74173.1 O-antigen chain length regulator [Aeromonas veronii]WIJ40599.1 Wzz/FepE/Etk N-terminal domain-containing protein [Aeromonas veronii]